MTKWIQAAAFTYVVTKWIQIVAFILIVIAAILGGRWYTNRLEVEQARQAQVELDAKQEAQKKLMESLKTEDVIVGTGAEATAGKVIKVNYEGTFDDGSVFDSSYKRNQPFEFTLGNGDVIKGWDLGVAGMKVGGKRKLTIPPELGYGETGAGPIPGNSTLHFVVELLEVK